MAATNKKTTMNTQRYSDLKQMLEDRKKEILAELQDKIRDVRTENVSGKVNTVLDPGESSEAEIQEDIEFALIQMKSETLNKINEALTRLEEGAYGNCFECGEEIAEPRLRALPFAVRCKDCEEARETAETARAYGVAARVVLRCSSTCRTDRRPAAGRARGRGARPASSGLRRADGVSRDERSTETPSSEELSSGERPVSIPPELPILPLRDTVLFPNSFMPLAVARESSVRLIDDAIANGKLIARVHAARRGGGGAGPGRPVPASARPRTSTRCSSCPTAACA